MAITIPIISEFSPKGIDKAVQEFKRLETSGQKAQFLISKAAIPAAAALAGLTAAAGLSVKKAIEAEAQQSRLAQILKTTGGATDAQVKSLNAQAKALQRVGVASAGNITVLQSQLATFDLQFDTIQRLTPAITDYVIAEKGATASAEDFKSMTNALAQALQGNFTALTKSGFVLDEQTKSLIKNGTEAERSAALVDVLNSTYKGFNETARTTAEGRMVALRNSLDSVQESIGRALLPVLERTLPVLEKFAIAAEENTGAILAVGGAVAALAGSIVALKAALVVKAAVAAFGGAAFVAAGKVMLAVGAVVALKVALDKIAPSSLVAENGTISFGHTLRRMALGPIGLAVLALDMLQVAMKAATGGFKKAAAGFAESGQRHLGELQSGVGSAVAKVNESLETQDKKLGGSAKAVESYSSRFKKALEDAVGAARDRLKDATEEMNKFAEGVKDALLGAFGFGDALKAGEETGGGFLAGLQAQAEKVLEYSRQVNQLLDAGLSKDALQRVLAAGTEAGSEIAKQLIEGGAEAIEETNRLVESTQLAADRIGVLAGEKYFGAGVVFAQRVVDGLQDRLNKLTPRLMAQMDALAKRLGRTVNVDVRIREIVQRVEARVGGIPALASGGIVNRPTLALIGEAGPEAVIPLSKLGQQQTGGGDTTINIYSTIADEGLPEKLVQALRTYNRTTGPVRIQVI